jgi:hypothetical protein
MSIMPLSLRVEACLLTSPACLVHFLRSSHLRYLSAALRVWKGLEILHYRLSLLALQSHSLPQNLEQAMGRQSVPSFPLSSSELGLVIAAVRRAMLLVAGGREG